MFLQSNSVAQTHTNGLSRVLLQGSQKQQSPEQIVLVLLAVTLAYLALPLLTFPAMLNVVRVAKKGFFFFFTAGCKSPAGRKEKWCRARPTEPFPSLSLRARFSCRSLSCKFGIYLCEAYTGMLMSGICL